MHSTKFSIAALFLVAIVSCQPPNVDTKTPKRFFSESYSGANDLWKKHSKFTVSYNEDGSLSKTEETQSDTSTTSTINANGTTTYEYNAKGLLMKSNKSSLINNTWTTSFSSNTLSSSSVERESYTYEYDTSDRLVKSLSQLTSTSDRRVIGEIKTYSYDMQGKLLSCDVVTRYSLSETKANFVFQNGTLLKYSESVPNSITDFEINSTGLLTKISSGPYISSRRTYDANGNLVKEESQFSGTNPTVTHTYSYDKAPVPRSIMPTFKGHPDDLVAKLFDPSANNVIKEIILNNSQSASPVTSEINYNVSYDSDGLLTNKSWVDPTNRAYYKKYTYTYQ
jgi:hypothetical protein